MQAVQGAERAHDRAAALHVAIAVQVLLLLDWDQEVRFTGTRGHALSSLTTRQAQALTTRRMKPASGSVVLGTSCGLLSATATEAISTVAICGWRAFCCVPVARWL